MNTEQVEVKRKPGRPKTKTWAAAPAQGKRKTKAIHDDSVHAARVEDERAAVDVHDMEDEPWVNPVSLPFVKPRAGMVQRWIRVAIRGESDPVNTARKFREGWVPRPVSSVPKNVPVPRVESGKYAGCVGVEGMVLCEMSEARNKQRNEYFARKNRSQSEAIDARLVEETRHNASGFGQVEIEKKSKFVREVAVAPD